MRMAAPVGQALTQAGPLLMLCGLGLESIALAVRAPALMLLAMVPLGLVVMLSIASPDYLPVLLKNPTGHKLLYGAGVLAVIGVLWIRRIIQVEV